MKSNKYGDRIPLDPSIRHNTHFCFWAKTTHEYCVFLPLNANLFGILMEDNSVLNFFYDVPNDAYYYEAVKWAAENGITGGVGNSLFAPNQPCNRAQIVTFLWRAAGSLW